MKALHEVRNYPTGYMVWEDCYDNMGFLAHWHREIELIYVREGKANISIENTELAARAGDLIVVDTGDFHYSPTPKQKNRLDFILFDPSIISPYYHHAHFFSPLVTADMLKKYGMTKATQKLFDLVHTELEREDSYYQEIVSARLRDFMYRLRRRHQGQPAKADISHRAATLQDIQRLLVYIDQHYDEPMTLADAAEKMNLSQNHFSQLFSNVVGINFLSYLNTVRIEHAAYMIQNSKMKIIDVALACGFENIRSFNRCFKQYTGYPPESSLRSRNRFASRSHSIRESWTRRNMFRACPLWSC